jgi:geranylgeranyl pyrophosphate synthase
MESISLKTSPKFSELVREDLAKVEALMQSQAKGQFIDLQIALDNLLRSGGKRIRPTITLLIGRMLKADIGQLTTLAAAIEMLHTATLVHDDLIDGSLIRRGMPTMNAKWSPGATVLTGDFLFARSAELAADTNSIEVTKLFAQTLSEIVNGEITQLLTSKCIASRQNYFNRIYAKTASLFRTSCCSAAIISQVDESIVQSMRTFGHEIGMAFQIIDDILDFTGEQVTVGKPVASDLRLGLITLPTLVFIENNPEDSNAQSLMNGDCEILENDEQLEHMISSIRNSGAIEKSFDEARIFVERGLLELKKQPACKERDALELLAQYIIRRKI